MKTVAPPETKVAAGGLAGLIVTAVLASLATWWPGFTQPPTYLTSLIVTIASLLLAYYAPHTPRPGDTPAPAAAAVPAGSLVLTRAEYDTLRKAAGLTPAAGAFTASGGQAS